MGGSKNATWRIVAQAPGAGADQTYAVYRGGRRVAWGLKHREAAVRWIVRLGGRPPQPVTPATREAGDAAQPESSPKRVWWNREASGGEDGGT